MTTFLDEVFGTGGLFAQKFEGYEPRQCQIDGAKLIAEVVRRETQRNAAIEAGTGTGKGLMYLVPILRDMHEDPTDTVTVTKQDDDGGEHEEEEEVPRRLIVSTANTSLQDQLVHKDLPLLREILPWDFTFGLLKGRAQYLCIDQLVTAEKEVAEIFAEDPKQIRQVLDWAKETKTGDRNEITFPVDKIWSSFSVSGEECIGTRCDHYKKCWYERAKKKASAVDVTVTNHSMLSIHLRLRGDTGKHLLLPRFSVVVVDEAHELARYARTAWGFQLSNGAVRRAVYPWRGIVTKETHTDLMQESRRVFSWLTDLAEKQKEARIDPGEITDEFAELAALLTKTSLEARKLSQEGDKEYTRGAKRLKSLTSRLRLVLEPDDNLIYWLEVGEKSGLAAVRGEPLEVGDLLKDALFTKVPTAVVTSATLTTGGGERTQWEYLEREIGLTRHETRALPSPFRLQEQLRVCVPALPFPDAEDRDDALVEMIERTILEARGRTLALFTSRRVMDYVHEQIVARKRLPYLLLKQDDAPVPRLVEKFREDVESVLFGVASLWTGIDVPGETLSCLIIDRLPFTPKDDPVISAYRAKLGNACFDAIQLPEAIIHFRQGAGRLIRTSHDRGVLVVMDGRIQRRQYGHRFLGLGAPISIINRVGDVGRFLYGPQLRIGAAR